MILVHFFDLLLDMVNSMVNSNAMMILVNVCGFTAAAARCLVAATTQLGPKCFVCFILMHARQLL
jgi:hypothetical protein